MLSSYVECVFEGKNTGVAIYYTTHIMSIDFFLLAKEAAVLICEFSVFSET